MRTFAGWTCEPSEQFVQYGAFALGFLIVVGALYLIIKKTRKIIRDPDVGKVDAVIRIFGMWLFGIPLSIVVAYIPLVYAPWCG